MTFVASATGKQQRDTYLNFEASEDRIYYIYVEPFLNTDMSNSASNGVEAFAINCYSEKQVEF